MVSSAASADWSAGGNPGWWGHFAPHVLIAAILSSILLVVRPLPAGSLEAALVPVALVAVVLVTWVQMRRHDRSLCELCMAAMPLDAPAAAHRYRRRLAVAHLGSHRRALVLLVAVFLAMDVLLVAAPVAWMTGVSCVWGLVQLTLVYLVLSHTTHRRLQPWCPRCSDGGGGTDAPAPDPVPSDFGYR